MNPLDFYSDPGLQTAQQQSQQAGQAYQTATKNAATMPDLLKQALDKKFSENNPLIQQREAALKNYMTVSETAPQSVLPENTGGRIFSPLEQSGLIAGQRAGALAPITSLNDILGWQQGGIQNTIGEATRMYQALVQAAQIESQNKRQSYQDLLSLISGKAGQATSDRAFAEDVRQFNETIKIRREENAREGIKSTDKRTQQSTDEALSAMQEHINAAIQSKPDADVKALIWQWVHANEPYFGSQGVDSSKLWDVYKKTPSKPKSPQTTKQGGGGLVGGILNWFK